MNDPSHVDQSSKLNRQIAVGRERRQPLQTQMTLFPIADVQFWGQFTVIMNVA